MFNKFLFLSVSQACFLILKFAWTKCYTIFRFCKLKLRSNHRSCFPLSFGPMSYPFPLFFCHIFYPCRVVLFLRRSVYFFWPASPVWSLQIVISRHLCQIECAVAAWERGGGSNSPKTRSDWIDELLMSALVLSYIN